MNGRKSCQAKIEYDVSYTRERGERGTETHEKAFGFRMYVKKDEGKPNSQPDPEDNEAEYKACEG